jgi:hypothetical protein
MGEIFPSKSPWYPPPTFMTSQPWEKAVRATARTAAFMPGASPPLVTTAIFMGFLLFPLYSNHKFAQRFVPPLLVDFRVLFCSNK